MAALRSDDLRAVLTSRGCYTLPGKLLHIRLALLHSAATTHPSRCALARLQLISTALPHRQAPVQHCSRKAIQTKCWIQAKLMPSCAFCIKNRRCETMETRKENKDLAQPKRPRRKLALSSRPQHQSRAAGTCRHALLQGLLRSHKLHLDARKADLSVMFIGTSPR